MNKLDNIINTIYYCSLWGDGGWVDIQLDLGVGTSLIKNIGPFEIGTLIKIFLMIHESLVPRLYAYSSPHSNLSMKFQILMQIVFKEG